MEIRSIGRSLAVLAAGALLVGGCGNSAAPTGSAPVSAATPKAADNGVAALEASAIVGRAKTALKSAKSFRMKGTVTDNGQKTALDFEISGPNVAGTMTLGTAAVKVLKVGGKQYMKPSPAFWKLYGGKQADSIIKLVGDKWVLVPASNKAFGGLFTPTDIDQLLAASGDVTKGPAKQIGGTPAIGLTDKGSSGGTLYVATVGKPYPLRIDGPTPADGGLAFSDFGATFADIKAPAAADVKDVSKIHA